MKTYSQDLREKMLAAVDRGMCPGEGGGRPLRRLPGDVQVVAEAAAPDGLGGAQEQARAMRPRIGTTTGEHLAL